MARAIGLAVATLAMLATGTFAFVVFSRVPSTRAEDVAVAQARQRNAEAGARIGTPKAKWAVGTRMSALHEMTVEVTADRLDDALPIAWQIVDPAIAEGYDEVLVYVRQPDDPAHTVRRVQWTRAGGYAELTFTAD
jgi:hypothetical protein